MPTSTTKARLVFAAVLATMCGLRVAADAAMNPVRSRFTTIDLKTCQIAKRHRDGNSWHCGGLRGYQVSYAEGDRRAFVSFGPDAEKRQAARQTLAPFNTIFARSGRRAIIEWRFRRSGGGDVPYATIMRFFTSRDGAGGEVLVVTRVSSTEACHMAYIDAKANPEAIALARSAADEMPASWSCATEPKVLGARGMSPL